MRVGLVRRIGAASVSDPLSLSSASIGLRRRASLAKRRSLLAWYRAMTAWFSLLCSEISSRLGFKSNPVKRLRAPVSTRRSGASCLCVGLILGFASPSELARLLARGNVMRGKRACVGAVAGGIGSEGAGGVCGSPLGICRVATRGLGGRGSRSSTGVSVVGVASTRGSAPHACRRRELSAAWR